MTDTDPRVARVLELLWESHNHPLDEGTMEGTAAKIVASLQSLAVAQVLTSEDPATEIYRQMQPMLSGLPIEPTSRAMMAHLAVMVDQTSEGMGAARGACASIGDSIWNLVIQMRNNQLKRKGDAE